MFAVTPSQLKKRVLALASKPQDRFLDLALSLEALHGVGTPGQFRQIVTDAGLGNRKAYYLVNIAEQLRPHLRHRARLQRLGWTKCQVIGRSLSGANFLELVKFAESHSTQELAAYAGKQKTSQTRCVLLYFTPSEYQRYEEAVLQFGARKRGRGLVGKEAATVRIAKAAMAAGPPDRTGRRQLRRAGDRAGTNIR